jgi:transposase
MQHIAIDLGGRKSQVCVRESGGTIVKEGAVETRKLPGYLSGHAKSVVVMETCAEAFGIADAAKEAGHEVIVVPSSLVHALGVGARGIKTDLRDARALSEASCRMKLPSVHIPTRASRDLKTQLGMRSAKIQCRTKLINTVRGALRSYRVRPKTGDTSTFGKRAKTTFLELGPIPPFIERQLEAIEALSQSIAQDDAALAQSAEQSEQCQRLMSVPGVGPIVSQHFVAALDGVDRFDDPHEVESYLGLTPGENSSSDRVRKTGITKAGQAQARWVLVQAAWRARQVAPNDPMVLWSLEVEKRRGRPIAVIALARKMAGILFAIWKKGTTYNPAHTVASTAT